MQYLRLISMLFLAILCAQCVTHKTSSIVSADYDKNKNQTNYVVLPIGSATLPGKWEKGSYNKVSNQQFFSNADSIEIAIAFNRYNEYEFNPNGAYKDWDFVQAFFEWEANHFEQSLGLGSAVLVQDKVDNYMIYRLFSALYDNNIDTYFLIGEKNGNVANISISTTDKWSESQKVEFLKSVYLK